MVPLLFVTAGSKSSGWMIDRSNEPDVAISREVDTCSISTGDGWTEGRNRFGLRFVTGSKILATVQELGCVWAA
jgi:hypothetical protein